MSLSTNLSNLDGLGQALFEYVTHPEIHARHIETITERQLRERTHPLVQADDDGGKKEEEKEDEFAGYGGGELFTETIVSYFFWIMEFLGFTLPDRHYRVEPGTLELQGQPKTVYRMMKNLIMVDKYARDIDWFIIPTYHAHFWLLAFCSFSYLVGGNNFPYCYDNAWADMALENGRPSLDSIYSVVDLFTWEGWVWMAVIYNVHYAFEFIA